MSKYSPVVDLAYPLRNFVLEDILVLTKNQVFKIRSWIFNIKYITYFPFDFCFKYVLAMSKKIFHPVKHTENTGKTFLTGSKIR